MKYRIKDKMLHIAAGNVWGSVVTNSEIWGSVVTNSENRNVLAKNTMSINAVIYDGLCGCVREELRNDFQ
jgi:hypothetical protein